MKLVNISTGQDLEDSKTLKDLHIQNDDVLGLCLRTETNADEDPAWEDLLIAEPT